MKTTPFAASTTPAERIRAKFSQLRAAIGATNFGYVEVAPGLVTGITPQGKAYVGATDPTVAQTLRVELGGRTAPKKTFLRELRFSGYYFLLETL